MCIDKINRIYVRRYRDNGQITAYVDWIDTAGRAGRTEANPAMFARSRRHWIFTFGTHMHALFERGRREGLRLQRETW